MVRIEEYDFGHMKIDGKVYRSDIIIPDRIIPDWRRKEGHTLCLDDVKDVLEDNPEVLVIGTGYSGLMHVPADIVSELERKGITVYSAKSGAAVDKYNQLGAEKQTAGAFHLTC